MDQPVGSNAQYLLSDYAKEWYQNIIPDSYFDGLYRHPHFLLQERLSEQEYNVPEKTVKQIVDGIIDLEDPQVIWISDTTSQSWLDPLKTLGLSRYLKTMPFMTSSDVLLGEDKLCKLMTFDEITWYCVVEIKNPVQYIKSLDTIRKVTVDFAIQAKEQFVIHTVDNWAVVCDNEKVYFITPFYGQTVEQRWPTLPEKKQQKLLNSLRDLLLLFEKKGLYWRDFAPRNMLCPNEDEIILIDFEHLIDTYDISLSERIVLDKYRRIWFGDVLSQTEIDYLFEAMPVYEVNRSVRCKADEMEEAYFGRSEIILEERFALLDMISKVERTHKYKKGVIHGHRLGLYMSDFLSSKSEASLYKILGRLPVSTWPTVLRTLQQTIDFDQLNYIISLYNKGVTTKVTETFLDEMRTRELSDSSLEYGVMQWIQQHSKQPGIVNN
jgi:hypothetical protein